MSEQDGDHCRDPLVVRRTSTDPHWLRPKAPTVYSAASGMYVNGSHRWDDQSRLSDIGNSDVVVPSD